jgi:hypothetical protein
MNRHLNLLDGRLLVALRPAWPYVMVKHGLAYIAQRWNPETKGV